MSEENDRRRRNDAREALLTSAMRLMLAERNWDPDAVPQDDEYEARNALALAARAYVQELNACGTHLWGQDDVEELRVQVDQLTAHLEAASAMRDRQTRIVSIFVEYHTTEHPLPKAVREKVLEAMGL